MLWLVPVSCLFALVFSGYLVWSILKRDAGTDHMKEISNAISEGSKIFLKRKNMTAAVFLYFMNPAPIQHILFATGIAATIAYYFLTQYLFMGLNLFYSMVAGIMVTIVIGLSVQYYTSYDRRPVQKIAKMPQSGPAITILAGLATGLMSVTPIILAICVAIYVAYTFAGIYGISIAVISMHAMTGVIVAIDSYGPITDNARGIASMAKLDPKTI